MAHKIKLFKIFAVFLLLQSTIIAQDFLLQGWYWDYPKTTDNNLWADTLRLKAQELADAGFTHVWLPPLSRASFGNSSNGYDPKDLFDLGLPAGGGATGFGTVTDLQNLIAEFNAVGIKAVADVVYNHRDGGKPENNPAVEGWIEGMTDINQFG
ncbi:MAG: alpha-amylase family glycosyl hydrolase [Calditrichia bacterium]